MNQKKSDLKDYYNLASKIIESNILNEKEASHLAVMFSDAVSTLKLKNHEEDVSFNKLLDLICKMKNEKR